MLDVLPHGHDQLVEDTAHVSRHQWTRPARRAGRADEEGRRGVATTAADRSIDGGGGAAHARHTQAVARPEPVLVHQLDRAVVVLSGRPRLVLAGVETYNNIINYRNILAQTKKLIK